MAARLQKRLLEVSEAKDAAKLTEVLNPLLEYLPAAFDKGITLGNLKHAFVPVKLDIPDDWTPVTPGPGWAAVVNQRIPAAAYRYVSETEIRCRGEVERREGVGTSILTGLPPAAFLHHCLVDVNSGAGRVDMQTSGVLFGGVNFVALDGVRYETSVPRPMWAKPVDVTVDTNDKQKDWGVPALVLAVSCTRDDGTPSMPLPNVHWENAFVAVQKSQLKRRVLRLHRVDGLRPGRQTVRLFCLYD